MWRNTRLRSKTATSDTGEDHSQISTLASSEVDLVELRIHASEHAKGFVTHSIRRRLWLQLLMHERVEIPRHYVSSHPDDRQVKLDLDRTQLPLDQTQKLMLEHTVKFVLYRNSWLRYFQGFNDVCSVFLFMLGDYGAMEACEHAALFFFRDFMARDFQHVHNYLGCLYSLIQCEDPKLYRLIRDTGLRPYFSTSWILTWFSHDIPNLVLVCRLFDFFLAHSPLMPVYFAAALVMHHRDALLALEPEHSQLHKYLLDVPNQLTAETLHGLIASSAKLWERYPAATVFAKGFHPYSCISTYTTLEEFLSGPGSLTNTDSYYDLGEVLVDTKHDSLPLLKDALLARHYDLILPVHPLDLPTNHCTLVSTWPTDKKRKMSRSYTRRSWFGTMTGLTG
ncbi:GTPase-activating protein gyp8 [Dispira simplex]|nr:GTPase-activating protein gyp8 [Dispira simplex]